MADYVYIIPFGDYFKIGKSSNNLSRVKKHIKQYNGIEDDTYLVFCNGDSSFIEKHLLSLSPISDFPYKTDGYTEIRNIKYLDKTIREIKSLNVVKLIDYISKKKEYDYNYLINGNINKVLTFFKQIKNTNNSFHPYYTYDLSYDFISTVCYKKIIGFKNGIYDLGFGKVEIKQTNGLYFKVISITNREDFENFYIDLENKYLKSRYTI